MTQPISGGPGGAWTLTGLGWDDEFAAALAVHPGTVAGRVTRVDRGCWQVLTAAGLRRATLGSPVLSAAAADPTAAPSAGDWCAVRAWPDERDTVEAVLPRRTSVVRAEAAGTAQGQVLAANVDLVAVVAGLHPEPHLGRVERLLALAWDSGATPLLVLTKADLAADADFCAEDVAAVAPGVEVLLTSTVAGRGIDRLRQLCPAGRTTALLGASGVGKSSLVNAVVNADVVGVRDIRADGKGRHTTVRRELVPVPGGGALIDTPGLRGVGLFAATRGTSAVFTEVDLLAARCRFADCGHSGEPGCAVLGAVADGSLPQRRLDSWRKLQRELAWMARRSDVRLAARERARWKSRRREDRERDHRSVGGPYWT